MKADVFIEGIALDIKLNENRSECIKVDDEGTETLVELNEITKLEVRIENPHFTSISFV